MSAGLVLITVIVILYGVFMNKTYSTALLAAVFLSVGFSGSDAYGQSGKLYINPMPLAGTDVPEPMQDELMPPIDVTAQKVSDERALLNSIVVPEPDSDYFDAPTEVSEPVEAPDAADLMPPVTSADESADEYEQWAAEQRGKYGSAQNNARMQAEPADDLTPVSAEAPRSAPTAINRLSTSPELTAKVNEITQDDYGQAQPLAAQMDWNALEGSSIRQVLQTWSSSADVRLMWLHENDFAVLNPFIMRSTYERAVQKMLDQYQDNHVRPVATLHIDPETGTKTLVVRVVEGQ